MTAEPTSARRGATIVRLPHEVDLGNAGALRDELLAALNRDDAHQLVVDALEVTFIDSSGVNALVRARQRAAQLGGSLHVASASPAVTRVLQITQLDGRLGLVSTLDEAFDCLRNPQTVHTCRAGG